MGDKQYFDSRVNGEIRAELVLDEQGDPVSSPGKRWNHYKINLFVDTNNPEVESITYKLDPTYYDPVRESTDVDDRFRVELTTYGDYPLIVDAQVGGEIVRKVVNLSELLNETYKDTKKPSIQSALKDIEAH